MAFAKGFLEKVAETKGKNSQVREGRMLDLFDVYSESFNKYKAIRYFSNLPANLVWRGDYSFTLSGHKKDLHFQPSTISDFLTIMQAVGKEMHVNLPSTDSVVEEESKQKLREFNSRLKRMI